MRRVSGVWLSALVCAAAVLVSGAGPAVAGGVSKSSTCADRGVRVSATLEYRKASGVVTADSLSWRAAGPGVSGVRARLWAMNGADTPVLRGTFTGPASASRPLSVSMPDRIAQQWVDVAVSTRSGEQFRCRVEFDNL